MYMANHENEDYLIKLFLDKVSKLQSNWCLWEWNPLNIDIEKLEDVNTLMRDVIGLYNELDGNLALQSDFTSKCRKAPCFSYGDIRHKSIRKLDVFFNWFNLSACIM